MSGCFTLSHDRPGILLGFSWDSPGHSGGFGNEIKLWGGQTSVIKVKNGYVLPANVFNVTRAAFRWFVATLNSLDSFFQGFGG